MGKAGALKGIMKELLEPLLKTVLTKGARDDVAKVATKAANDAYKKAMKDALASKATREAAQAAAEKAAREAGERAAKEAAERVGREGMEKAAREANKSVSEMSAKQAREAAEASKRRMTKDIPADYKKMRRKTPNKDAKDYVNQGHYSGARDKVTNDPAAALQDSHYSGARDKVFPQNTVNGKLQADHIVPMRDITRMDGFDKLTWGEKMEVLNYRQNFMGLSEAANSSKGAQPWASWWGHKKNGWPIDPKLRSEMIQRDYRSRSELQALIDQLTRGR